MPKLQQNGSLITTELLDREAKEVLTTEAVMQACMQEGCKWCGATGTPRHYTVNDKPSMHLLWTCENTPVLLEK